MGFTPGCQEKGEYLSPKDRLIGFFKSGKFESLALQQEQRIRNGESLEPEVLRFKKKKGGRIIISWRDFFNMSDWYGNPQTDREPVWFRVIIQQTIFGPRIKVLGAVDKGGKRWFERLNQEASKEVLTYLVKRLQFL